MSIPSQQKSLAILTKQGSWSVIDYDVDKPGPGEVLVRIESTALNPVDWKVQATGYFVNEYPAILGSDSAGVVVAVGEGVTNVAVGDKVLHQGYFTNRLATFKQYTVIASDIVAKIPDNVSFDEAATVPLGLATATIGLYNKNWGRGGANLTPPWAEGGRGKYANQPIVIFGGSSSVGQFAIQSAKLSGFSPIITTASLRNFDLVKSLGATHPIDRNLSHDQTLAEVEKITSEPVKIVYDAISQKDTEDTAYDILSPGGKLILVLPNVIDESKITPDKEVIGTFGTVHAEENRKFGQGLYSNITNYLKTGDLKPNPVEVLPAGLAGIPEGLDRMQQNKVSGTKLIAHPQETVTLKGQ